MIDIDGVISLFGFDPQRRPPGRFAIVDGVAHFLSQEVAARLIALAAEFDLVWCSGWEEKADEHLPHALGLPAGVPHIAFGAPGASDGRHWKLAAIDAYAGADRPLAGSTTLTTTPAGGRRRKRDGATLLIACDPAVGLTEGDAAQLSDWARALA